LTGPAIAQRPNALRLRIASAAVLIPVALAAVWFGPPWITIIVGVAGLAMAWELGRVATTRQLRGQDWAWIAIGAIWIASGCAAFLWLEATAGPTVVFWLLAVVWATDVFAYFVGKTIGGPRLAPRLSPNKTWAGAIGGLIGAGFTGLVVALASHSPTVSITCVSLALSLAAQGGDLAESWGKRHFSVKDTSGLIPGHGGVLDRLDGLLAATQALALLTFIIAIHIG
jgi:phosphatidate cytidylyltransferase